jgi:hypothetical protein
VTVRLGRTYPSRPEAERVAAAVAVDNPGFVRLRVDGPRIEIELDATTPARARATLDDLVACLNAAERTAAAAPPSDAVRR